MSNFFQSILPYLAGAGASGLSSQFSALAPFQAAIGAGAGALTNKKNRLAGAAQGFAGGGLGSTLAGGVKNLFNGGSTGLMDRFGQGAMSGIKSYGNSIPGFGGIGTNNPTGMFAKFFTPGTPASTLSNGGSSGTGGYSFADRSPLPSSNVAPYKSPGFDLSDQNTSGGFRMTATPTPLSFLGGGSPGGGTPGSNLINTASGTGGSTSSGNMNVMDMFKNMLPGAAVAGIGGLLAPTPDAPDYSGVRSDLLNRANMNDANNQPAISQYLSTLSSPIGGSAEGGIANAKLINDRQRQQAIKDLQQQFSANNGSLNGNSAYNDALAKTNAYYDQNYAAQAAQLQFQYDTQQQQQKMAAAQALSGLNDQQLQFYASLANLDIQTIQDRFQLDAGRAQGLKDIATQAGALMMQKSLGLDQIRR